MVSNFSGVCLLMSAALSPLGDSCASTLAYRPSCIVPSNRVIAKIRRIVGIRHLRSSLLFRLHVEVNRVPTVRFIERFERQITDCEPQCGWVARDRFAQIRKVERYGTNLRE